MEKGNINNVAIFSLVAGGLSMVLGMFGILGIISGVIAIILAIVALIKKNESILWIIGMVLAVLGITFSILSIESKEDIDGIITGIEETEETNIIDELEEIVTEQNKDLVSGNSWLEEEGSFLVLKGNGTFRYYRSQTMLDNNYYTGSYEVYSAEEAIKYIANELKEYGVTEQEQYDLINRNEGYDIKDYYCLVLNNEECIIDGKNTLKTFTKTPYMGMYFADKESLDLVNMNSATYYLFKKVIE